VLDADYVRQRRAAFNDGDENGHRTGNHLRLHVPDNKAKLTGQRAKHETN
jgi:hypothetical protein